MPLSNLAGPGRTGDPIDQAPLTHLHDHGSTVRLRFSFLSVWLSWAARRVRLFQAQRDRNLLQRLHIATLICTSRFSGLWLATAITPPPRCGQPFFQLRDKPPTTPCWGAVAPQRSKHRLQA